MSDFPFRFGDVVQPSLGVVSLSLPTVNGNTLCFYCDIVEENLPLLFGLDFMKQLDVHIDIPKIIMTTEDWFLPLEYKYGHLVVQMIHNIQFTKAELKKLHRHFWYPSVGKLFNSLKRTHPCDTDESVRKLLEEIRDKCETCAQIAPRQLLFQVGSIHEDEIIFTREVSIDLFEVDGSSVLHVIDVGTRFIAAVFLSEGESAEQVWDAFLKFCVLIYAVMPDIMSCDQGSV